MKIKIKKDFNIWVKENGFKKNYIAEKMGISLNAICYYSKYKKGDIRIIRKNTFLNFIEFFPNIWRDFMENIV